MNIIDATVFIVDDERAIRDSLTLMIEQENIATKMFENAESFLAQIETETLGCAILDVRMPGMDGLQIQKELLKRNIILPIIFLTGHGDIPMSVSAIKTGAVDFLTKPVKREKLLASIHNAILESERFLIKSANERNAISRLVDLTDREREVMALAIQGYPNKTIARHLGISHRTVEIHKSKIMYKTGVNDLLSLARLAHDSRLNITKNTDIKL